MATKREQIISKVIEILKENPDFEIRVRPIKHEPDSIYINKYIKLIEKELFV